MFRVLLKRVLFISLKSFCVFIFLLVSVSAFSFFYDFIVVSDDVENNSLFRCVFFFYDLNSFSTDDNS